jgi:hypothetical protein
MPVPIVPVVVKVAAAVRTRRAGSTAAYQRALADDDAERRAELADLLAREADPDRREIYARLLDRADRDADAQRDFGLALARARSARFAKLGRPLDAATMAALLSAAIRSNRLSALACGGPLRSVGRLRGAMHMLHVGRLITTLRRGHGWARRVSTLRL